MAIAVHLASVWVPFTSEAKEAVAHYDDLLRELKLAIQECGRKLAAHIRASAHALREEKRRSLFERYIPEVASAISAILDMPADKIEKPFFAALPNFVRFADEGPGPGEGSPPTGAAPAEPSPTPPPPPPKGRAPSPAQRRPTNRRPARASLMAAKKAKGSPRKRAADGPTRTERDVATLGKIEKLARQALSQATKGDNPALDIRTRTLSNVSFNQKRKIIELGDRTQTREFFNVNMARKFMQTMLVASGCKTLIGEGKTVSIRQMFYMTKHTLPGRARTPSKTRARAIRSSRTSRSASTRSARSCISSPTGGASSSAS